MAEKQSYLPGTPSWTDVMVPDLDAAKAFYGEVFGWTFASAAEFGGYTTCLMNGKSVCGMMQHSDGPAAWTTYFDTRDADASVAAITAHGGNIIAPTTDVGALGRMALAQDPTGAVFGLWQPKSHHGAALINEPGAMSWHELWTRDAAQAIAFYQAVLDRAVEKMPMPGMEYYTVKAENQMHAGMMPMPPHLPAAVPSHWLTYFAVGNADETSARIKALGGTVTVEPFDVPFGRNGFARDRAGASFAFIQLKG
jgi:hypothetical protein